MKAGLVLTVWLLAVGVNVQRWKGQERASTFSKARD
jgi:hypothetical protein